MLLDAKIIFPVALFIWIGGLCAPVLVLDRIGTGMDVFLLEEHCCLDFGALSYRCPRYF